MDHVALGPARQVVADTPKPKRLNPFERYLSLWVALCMVTGVLLGLAVPGSTDGSRRLEFGAGSQINIPIAILIWLMITPMMMLLLSVCSVCNRTRHWFPAPADAH